MSRSFREVFSQRHVVLPVIHIESSSQAIRNSAIARDCRCDGVFLINHGVSQPELLHIHRAVSEEFPDLWVGINSLGSDPERLFREIGTSVRGVWTDNAGIEEQTPIQQTPRRIARTIASAGWPGLYFGGVAFKYQREVRDLARAAKVATEFMDVVTTSGPGTGLAAALDKVRTMKQAIGERPLAVASGITPDNVAAYLPWVDAYLVATGISSSFTELDPTLVESLVRQIRG